MQPPSAVGWSDRMSTASDLRPDQATEPLVLPVEVVRVAKVSPSMVRITLAGERLHGFAARGADQWVRIFLPREGQRLPVLPTSEQWWPETCAIPEPIRPIVRNYTVRRSRPTVGELDIDIVRHGDTGPGTRWAGRARVGDRIGILDQSTTYTPQPNSPWRLLLGDESALPAIGSIVEGLPAGVRAIAFVEVPSPLDMQHFESASDLTVHWLPRTSDLRVGARVLTALRGTRLPDGCPYVFLSGEQRLVRNARRLLVGGRGYDRMAICFMSYWRLGQ